MPAPPSAPLRWLRRAWRISRPLPHLLARTLQATIAALDRALGRPFTPRLGVLAQYEPRPLNMLSLQVRLPADSPVISIVTPSFNQGAFIERTIRSVLDQGYPRLQYIVQDGGSTDGTAAILERYRGRLAWCASEPDKGQADAVNRGFRRATGDILAYLNSDDVLLPGALAYVANYFARHPHVDVVYGHRIVIDHEDCEVGRWVLPAHDNEALGWCDYVPQETLFWRRRVWERIGGGLDEGFQFALDWDLLLRLRDAGAKLARVPHFLAAFRLHPDQKTSARLHDLGAAEMNRLRRRCHGRDVTPAEAIRHMRSYLRRQVWHTLLYRLGWV
jgi:GT2 family glycosyltransferase